MATEEPGSVLILTAITISLGCCHICSPSCSGARADFPLKQAVTRPGRNTRRPPACRAAHRGTTGEKTNDTAAVAALPALVIAGALMAFVVYISNVLVGIRIGWLNENWFSRPVHLPRCLPDHRHHQPPVRRAALWVIAIGFLGGVAFFVASGGDVGAGFADPWSVGQIALGSLTSWSDRCSTSAFSTACASAPGG